MSDTILCVNCNENRNKIHKNCIETSRKSEEVIVGRGYSVTEEIYYKCSECACQWREIIDSGVGGHGHFVKRLGSVS